MARHRDTKRNRQSRNVLRHRRRIAGLGAATGMFVAAAVAPLATTPAAGADLVNPVVNTVSGLAVFDPPTGTGGGDSTDPTTPGMAGGGGKVEPAAMAATAAMAVTAAAEGQAGRRAPAARAVPAARPAPVVSQANPANRATPASLANRAESGPASPRRSLP